MKDTKLILPDFRKEQLIHLNGNVDIQKYQPIAEPESDSHSKVNF